MNISNSLPKVSVCVVTYNHEKYIGECLESLVTQVTDFDYEIIVGEDCSTDGTKQIVEAYAKSYPEKIVMLAHEKNIGASENYYRVHAAARGEYICHLDGDDYALPGKLQVQADHLDAHPECRIVWHRMRIKNERTGEIVDDLFDVSVIGDKGIWKDDILRFITLGMHSSKMYRAALREFEIPKFTVLDFYINVEQLGSGWGNFAGTRPLGVYRTGLGLASSGTTNEILRETLAFFSKRYPESRKAICSIALVKLIAALRNRRWIEAAGFYMLSLRTWRLSAVVDIFRRRNVYAMLKIPNSIRLRKE